MIEARLRAIEYTEANALGGQPDGRVDSAVDQNSIHEALGHLRGGRRKSVERRPGKLGSKARAIIPPAFGVDPAARIGSRSSCLIGLIHMGIPQVSGHAPLPGRILFQNVLGDKALVLNDERNANEIREQARVDQTDFEVID